MNIQYFLLARAGASSSPRIYRSALWLAAVAWSTVSLVTPWCSDRGGAGITLSIHFRILQCNSLVDNSQTLESESNYFEILKSLAGLFQFIVLRRWKGQYMASPPFLRILPWSP